MTPPASSSSPLTLTVVTLGADSFQIFSNGAELRWTFPPVDTNGHGDAPSAAIRLTSTTSSPLVKEIFTSSDQTTWTTITAIASPAATTTSPAYAVSVTGFSKWQVLQSGKQKRWTIPQKQAAEAFFELHVEMPTFPLPMSTSKDADGPAAHVASAAAAAAAAATTSPVDPPPTATPPPPGASDGSAQQSQGSIPGLSRPISSGDGAPLPSKQPHGGPDAALDGGAGDGDDWMMNASAEEATGQNISPGASSRRAGSPSIQSAESPAKKRKPLEGRARTAIIYSAKQIKPIDDGEMADAYLKRHIKLEHPPAERNGHSAFEALIRALGLQLTAMQLRLDLLDFMSGKDSIARKLLAGLSDDQYVALKHRLIPGGRMIRPDKAKEKRWLDFARQCGPENHFVDDLLPLMAHKYAAIVACFSREGGPRESWSYLPEWHQDDAGTIQSTTFPAVGIIRSQAANDDSNRESFYAVIELNDKEALPPISVWRLGDAKALTSVVRRASHKRCHKLFWFESRGTYKKAGTTECICKIPTKGPAGRKGGRGGAEGEGKGKGKAEEEEDEEENDEGEESELTEED